MDRETTKSLTHPARLRPLQMVLSTCAMLAAPCAVLAAMHQGAPHPLTAGACVAAMVVAAISDSVLPEEYKGGSPNRS